MNQGLIPKRYAKALYEVAKDRGADLKLYRQMVDLSAAFANEPALQPTMDNPFVSDQDKAALVMSACGADNNDAMLNDMVKLLANNHRMDIVRDIAMAYQDIYRKANHIYRVNVVSAQPLDTKAEERLKAMVTKKLDGGSMEYSHSVDPDLIGGFVINIDNQRLDASVKNELKQLRLNLLSNK